MTNVSILTMLSIYFQYYTAIGMKWSRFNQRFPFLLGSSFSSGPSSPITFKQTRCVHLFFDLIFISSQIHFIFFFIIAYSMAMIFLLREFFRSDNSPIYRMNDWQIYRSWITHHLSNSISSFLVFSFSFSELSSNLKKDSYLAPRM